MKHNRIELITIAIISNLMFMLTAVIGGFNSSAEAEQATGCGYKNINVLSADNSQHINSNIAKFMVKHKDIRFLKKLECGSGDAKASDTSDGINNSIIGSFGVSDASDMSYTSVPIAYKSTYNWAGIQVVQANNTANNITPNYVAVSYTQPKIKNASDSNVCFWTGLGDSNIIQNGTVADANNNSTISHRFWWEILGKNDKGMINIRNLPLKANDNVYSTTYWKNGSAYILMVNLTQKIGISFSVPGVDMPNPVAEIITERPTNSYSIGNNKIKQYYKDLSNFDRVAYTFDFGNDFNKGSLYYSNFSMINSNNKTLVESGTIAKNIMMTNWLADK